MKIEKEKITIDDFSAWLSYEDAIDLEANTSAERNQQKSYVEEKKKLLDRYKDKIQHLISVRTNLQHYNTLAENGIKLENLEFRLNKTGLSSRICKKSQRKNQKDRESVREDIINSAQKTNNLPVLSTYEKKGYDYDLQEENDYALQIDSRVMEDFCGQLFVNIGRDQRSKSEHYEYYKKISQYATENNLTIEEAKESFKQEEFNKNVVENNSHSMDIETIKKLLETNPPENVLSNYSEKEIDVFKKNMQVSKISLAKYEKCFKDLLALKEEKQEIEDAIAYLKEIDNSAMSLKAKNKLKKKLKKEINKKTKKIEKVEVELTEIREKGNLDKYFNDIKYYESVVQAQNALGKEGDVSPEKIEEWKKINEEYWNGEILEANIKDNKQNQFALPPPVDEKKQEFYNRLDQRNNPNVKTIINSEELNKEKDVVNEKQKDDEYEIQ